MPNFGK